MPSKKKRISLVLDNNHIKQLNDLCIKFKTKQYSRVIKYLLDLISINN